MAQPLKTRSDWLAAHPPRAEQLTQTLAGVAARARTGEDFRHAAREFLDEFALRDDDTRPAAIADRPEPTGDRRYDAYFRRRGIFIPERSLHRV